MLNWILVLVYIKVPHNYFLMELRINGLRGHHYYDHVDRYYYPAQASTHCAACKASFENLYAGVVLSVCSVCTHSIIWLQLSTGMYVHSDNSTRYYHAFMSGY